MTIGEHLKEEKEKRGIINGWAKFKNLEVLDSVEGVSVKQTKYTLFTTPIGKVYYFSAEGKKTKTGKKWEPSIIQYPRDRKVTDPTGTEVRLEAEKETGKELLEKLKKGVSVTPSKEDVQEAVVVDFEEMNYGWQMCVRASVAAKQCSEIHDKKFIIIYEISRKMVYGEKVLYRTPFSKETLSNCIKCKDLAVKDMRRELGDIELDDVWRHVPIYSLKFKDGLKRVNDDVSVFLEKCVSK
jgi:YHS domain-containing protein